MEQVIENYPALKADDLRACLAYASDVLHSEKVYPLNSVALRLS